MCKRYPLFLSLLAFSLFTLNFRCEKESLARPFDHTFAIPLTISPLKKTYSVTDTIWLETLVQGKRLRDKLTNTEILVDSGAISLRVSYYGFGIGITNPTGGFCTIISATTNIGTELSPWATVGAIEGFGCTQNSYRIKIGFKPNYKGTYCLLPTGDLLLQSCPTKVVPYNSSIAYQFQQTDLNEEVFTAFASKENLGSDQQRHFKNKLEKGEMFVFKVE